MALHTPRFRAVGCALIAGVTLTLGAVSCGSDDSSSATTTPVTSPEEHLADDAAVTAGLARMTATAASIAATVASGTKVDDAQDQLEVDWKQVEGTFKANEPDLYLSVEEALNGIGEAASAGNAADTARFVADLETATTAYLAKHP
jgi:hypothetical protein